jgi:hypothetical protein
MDKTTTNTHASHPVQQHNSSVARQWWVKKMSARSALTLSICGAARMRFHLHALRVYHTARHQLRLKWHPNHYIVHYFWPRPDRVLVKSMTLYMVGNRAPFLTDSSLAIVSYLPAVLQSPRIMSRMDAVIVQSEPFQGDSLTAWCIYSLHSGSPSSVKCFSVIWWNKCSSQQDSTTPPVHVCQILCFTYSENDQIK